MASRTCKARTLTSHRPSEVDPLVILISTTHTTVLRSLTIALLSLSPLHLLLILYHTTHLQHPFLRPIRRQKPPDLIKAQCLHSPHTPESTHLQTHNPRTEDVSALIRTSRISLRYPHHPTTDREDTSISSPRLPQHHTGEALATIARLVNTMVSAISDTRVSPPTPTILIRHHHSRAV